MLTFPSLLPIVQHENRMENEREKLSEKEEREKRENRKKEEIKNGRENDVNEDGTISHSLSSHLPPLHLLKSLPFTHPPLPPVLFISFT